MNGHASVTDNKGTANKKDEVEGLGSQKGHLPTYPKSKGIRKCAKQVKPNTKWKDYLQK